MSKPKKPAANSGTIALNKKAKHDYFIEQRFEAGIALAGWEVKSLREGKVQLVDSYIMLKNNEAFLLGAHITPLKTASTHVIADPTRTRKLLLHARELDKLIGGVQAKGFACVLERPPGQMRNRPGTRQERLRQAPEPERTRLGSREAAGRSRK
jgi:SsrA-binding protein